MRRFRSHSIVTNPHTNIHAKRQKLVAPSIEHSSNQSPPDPSTGNSSTARWSRNTACPQKSWALRSPGDRALRTVVAPWYQQKRRIEGFPPPTMSLLTHSLSLCPAPVEKAGGFSFQGPFSRRTGSPFQELTPQVRDSPLPHSHGQNCVSSPKSHLRINSCLPVTIWLPSTGTANKIGSPRDIPCGDLETGRGI